MLETPKAVDTNSNPPGWHPIHVYYGKMDHLVGDIDASQYWSDWQHPKDRKWMSQHGQDVAVMKVLDFPREGFFIDLAANDAVWASNTFTLEQKFGWKGICIEPNPIYWYRLSFRKCHALGTFVGANDGAEVEVALSDKSVHGPFGGIVGKDFDNKKSKETQKRYTASLRSILKRFNAPNVIDYMSLDVEGAEYYIMKDFPFEEYIFKVLTVERPNEELQALLKKHKYHFVYKINKRADDLYVHESILAQAQKNLKVRPEEIGSRTPKLPAAAFVAS